MKRPWRKVLILAGLPLALVLVIIGTLHVSNVALVATYGQIDIMSGRIKRVVVYLGLFEREQVHESPFTEIVPDATKSGVQPEWRTVSSDERFVLGHGHGDYYSSVSLRITYPCLHPVPTQNRKEGQI